MIVARGQLPVASCHGVHWSLATGHWLLLLVLSVSTVPQPVAGRQEPATPADTAQAPAAIPASEIVSRAEQAIIELREIRAVRLPDLGVDEIGENLPDVVRSLSQLKGTSDPERLTELSVRRVEHFRAR